MNAECLVVKFVDVNNTNTYGLLWKSRQEVTAIRERMDRSFGETSDSDNQPIFAPTTSCDRYYGHQAQSETLRKFIADNLNRTACQ